MTPTPIPDTLVATETIRLTAEDLRSFPSAFQQARNLVKQAWISTTAAIRDGRGLIADANVAATRLSICEGCQFFSNNKCSECGCLVSAKAHLVAAECPQNLWGENTKVWVSNSVGERDKNLKSVIDTFTDREKQKLNMLIVRNRDAGLMTFNFKERAFKLQYDETGQLRISSRPISVTPVLGDTSEPTAP